MTEAPPKQKSEILRKHCSSSSSQLTYLAEHSGKVFRQYCLYQSDSAETKRAMQMKQRETERFLRKAQ